MSQPLPQLETDPQPPSSPVCRMLRTKTAFGSYGPDADPWDSGESTTAVYWCLGTMETAGPDDAFAHPHTCLQGRPCYQKPLD
jgi:hypothetical protein